MQALEEVVSVPTKDLKDQNTRIKNSRQNTKPISTFRRILPQVLAGTAKNLILYDLGTVVGFQTFLLSKVLDAKTGLSFTATDSIWFSSLLLVGQLVGSLLSGALLEPIGRKRSLVLLNFPLLLGWIGICSEYYVSAFYVTSIINGLAVGAVKIQAISYIGEISEPKIRGILTAYSELSIALGMLTVYLLGVYLRWQVVAYICAALPVVSALFISSIPESPIWLLANGKTESAKEALCWLRGWARPEDVQEEISQLVFYTNEYLPSNTVFPEVKHICDSNLNLKDENVIKKQENLAKRNKYEDESDTSSDDDLDLTKFRFYSIDLGSRKSISKDIPLRNLETAPNNTNISIISMQNVIPFKKRNDCFENKDKTNISYRKKVIHSITALKRHSCWRPLLLMSGFFLFLAASGYGAIQPFTLSVYKDLGFDMNPYNVTIMSILILCLGKVSLMLLVYFMGKRCLMMLSCLGCGTTMVILGAHISQTVDTTIYEPLVNLILYLGHVYSYGLGLGSIPWMYLSEVFPYRGRAMAIGLSAAMSYIFEFLVTKTCLTIKTELTLLGTFFIFGVISLLGIVYVYLLVPETEGKSLEDIENNNFNKNKS